MKKNLILAFLVIIILAIVGFVTVKFLLPKKTNPENVSTLDLAKNGIPANFTVDYSKEQGKFSNFIFTGFDSPGYEEASYNLLSKGGFDKIAVFDDQFSLEKAKSLAAKNLEVIMHIHAERYETKEQLQTRVGKILDMIEGIKKSVPNLRLTTFLFANEPNVTNSPFWHGTEQQLFEDYGYFAEFMKSKNPQYIVGGLGFAYAPGIIESKAYISDFVAYSAKNNLPLDFLPFHGYTTEIKYTFSDEMQIVNDILDKYPKLSPLFGRTKVAVTEMDIEAFPIPCSSKGDYSEFDGTWRAAHNTLTKMALVEKGVWMIFQVGGPNEDKGEGCFLWKKTDGSLKPIYYAYQAFNKFFGETKLETTGSNFETYGITVGKSADGKSITAVVVNYDEKQFFSLFPKLKDRLGPPGRSSSLPRQTADATPAKQFEITLKNLPWGDAGQIKYERKVVDDKNNLSVVESKTIDAKSEIKIDFQANLPEVDLITLQAP